MVLEDVCLCGRERGHDELVPDVDAGGRDLGDVHFCAAGDLLVVAKVERVNNGDPVGADGLVVGVDVSVTAF